MVFKSEKFVLNPRWNRNKKCARESNAARLLPTTHCVGQRAPFAHMCRDPTPAAHVELALSTTAGRSVVSRLISLVRAFNIVVGKMPCTGANAARCAALRVIVQSNYLCRARPIEPFSTRRPQRRVNDGQADVVLVVIGGVLRSDDVPTRVVTAISAVTSGTVYRENPYEAMFRLPATSRATWRVRKA